MSTPSSLSVAVSNWDELTLCDVKATNTNIHARAELSRATDGEHLMDIVRLIEDGAEANETDDLGRTALSWAAVNGRPDMVQWLIEYGADVNTVDSYRRTPLSWGAQAGAQLVRILIDRGANVNLAGRNGLRPLEVAVEFGHRDEATIVKKILENNEAKRSWKHRLCHRWLGHRYCRSITRYPPLAELCQRGLG
ncbi:hypothetical protein ACJ73_01170 [Blastomyces percursus]|uniref:Uncharacterized protein n=1 Tax=Blastomyces percursus TaxID=1658174 RepID=A0A1J9QH72_9EURO|nr:hypothetical protein ACJ73_01170 [Blastomyces percursus]